MLLGRYGEALAAEFLRKKGCRILAMNYRTRLGELDVIAADRRYVIFAEVKLRKNAAFAEARECRLRAADQSRGGSYPRSQSSGRRRLPSSSPARRWRDADLQWQKGTYSLPSPNKAGFYAETTPCNPTREDKNHERKNELQDRLLREGLQVPHRGGPVHRFPHQRFQRGGPAQGGDVLRHV